MWKKPRPVYNYTILVSPQVYTYILYIFYYQRTREVYTHKYKVDKEKSTPRLTHGSGSPGWITREDKNTTLVPFNTDFPIMIRGTRVVIWRSHIIDKCRNNTHKISHRKVVHHHSSNNVPGQCMVLVGAPEPTSSPIWDFQFWPQG